MSTNTLYINRKSLHNKTMQKAIFNTKDLYALIWPLVVEQFLAIFVGMADIVMVSSLGETAVSGVSLVDSLNILLFQVFQALATGGVVVASQFIGQKNMLMAQKTAYQLVYATIAIAVVVMLGCLSFHRFILRAIFGSIEVSVMDNAQRYFVITIFTLPFIALYNSSAALFRASGNSRVSMLVSLLINILNVIGNAVFLYGLKFGVEGVAFPTLISRMIAAFLLLVLLYKGKSYRGRDTICIKGISHIKIDFRLVWKILAIGIPTGLENSMFQIGKVLVLSLIASYGTVAIASNAAANTMASFEVLPASAIGLSMLTVIGQCVGACDFEQARFYTKKLMFMAYGFMWTLNLPLLLFSYKILGLYHLSSNTWTLAWYMTLLHGLLGIIIWPCSFTLPNALRAANDATFTMVVSMISMWSVRIGMSYVLKWNDLFGMRVALSWPIAFGAFGVWISMVLDWIVRSTAFIIRTRYVLHEK